MTTTRIVAAILDTTQLTLYLEDASTVVIPQGDVRVKRIIEAVTEPLSTQGWADVELGYANEGGNPYQDFEEQTSGVIKFFRVAKKFVKNLFNPETDAPVVDPVALGNVPTLEATVAESGELVPVADPKAASTPDKIRDATTNQKPSVTSAVDQIMANAKPVSDPNFNTADHNSDLDTMIAVVETKDGGKQVIPGVENLSNQMRVASKLGSTIGVQRFLERLGAVINDRGHSVMELLNFMSKGDLPIADDGSIIGYKVLRSTVKGGFIGPNDDPMPVPPTGYYVDCWSGRVLQRVGSYVTQEHVDPSRRTQCSTGLHIARRAYLSGFSGDIITLVKIAPEDVIAVPAGEPDKMRARGYHILAEIPKDEHSRLRANQPIEGMIAKKMLGMAIKGEHIGIIEDVVIGGPRGAAVKVTLREGVETKAPQITKDAPVAEALPDPEKKDGAAVVDAKAISQTVTANKTAAPETRAQRIERLLTILRNTSNLQIHRQAAADELRSISKTAKKSLKALGIVSMDEAFIQKYESVQLASKPEPVKAASKTAPVKKAAAQPKTTKPKESKKAAVPEITQEDITDHIKNLSRSEKAKHLLVLIEDPNNAMTTRRNAFQVLIALKRSAKVGWMQLGVKNFDAMQAMFEK